MNMKQQPADPVAALRVPHEPPDLAAWARWIVDQVDDIREHGQSEGLSAADIVALTLAELVAASLVAPAGVPEPDFKAAFAEHCIQCPQCHAAILDSRIPNSNLDQPASAVGRLPALDQEK